MKYGIRKGLEDIAWELKGIKNTLSSIWHSRYEKGETDILDPAAFSDEYISTEECARRLNVSDQTLRNWMALGRKSPDKGWIEGIHYVNASPNPSKKAIIRIPWNQLVQSLQRIAKWKIKIIEKKLLLCTNLRVLENYDNGSSF